MAEEKKSVMDKIKEKFEDKEEQFEYISVAVRLLVFLYLRKPLLLYIEVLLLVQLREVVPYGSFS